MAAAGRQGALHQGQGPDQGGGPTHGRAGRRAGPRGDRARRHRLHLIPAADSPPPRHAGIDEVARRAPARPRSRSHHHPWHAHRSSRSERQRQDHAPQPPRGHLAPDAGEIERAAALRLVRFEQHRSGLDPEQSLRRALAPEGDTVTFQGRGVHAAAWARRFLFQSEQLDVPVGRLSGGEQARILVARLMGEPADLLVLDEPTNDLDIPTLEVLEESLAEFDGGLVLVTHDRLMLDRVSTTILALDGEGGGGISADYAQWEGGRAG